MANDYNNTITLLQAIERNFPPSPLLVDTFFPNVLTFATNEVQMEYRKGVRQLAPFVVPGAKGVNMTRAGSKINTYVPPMMRPKRLITASDIEQRGFGENLYSTKTPAQRAADLRAKDLVDLTNMCTRRQEWMAAQILTTGACEIKGYADDGTTELVDTMTIPEFTNKVVLSGSNTWDNAGAKAYDDLGDMSQTIRRATGMVPTVAVMSNTVAKNLLANTQLRDIMLIPSRDNLALLSIQPQIQSPEVIRFGYITALNLELYIYDAVYAEGDTVSPYIPDDYLVMGIKGRGKRLFGSITQMEMNGELQTYEGAYVPKVTPNIEDDATTISVASRCVLCPEFSDDWGVIKTK